VLGLGVSLAWVEERYHRRLVYSIAECEEGLEK
jgi:hypothetical protein